MSKFAERPLGEPVDFIPPPVPPSDLVLDGVKVRLEPLAKRHAVDLEAEFRGHDALWDYMPYGPFAGLAAYETWVASIENKPDPVFFAIINRASNRAIGQASFLRITPQAGSIEVGHIAFSPALQGTTHATEAMFLMMRWVFAAGYRRYEWKCNALNLPSRRAAQRLGFSYEGVFRQHLVSKGRNRDTAWFAMIDGDWPALQAAFEAWLDPANFDAAGRQKVALSTLTHPLLVVRDPVLTG